MNALMMCCCRSHITEEFVLSWIITLFNLGKHCFKGQVSWFARVRNRREAHSDLCPFLKVPSPVTALLARPPSRPAVLYKFVVLSSDSARCLSCCVAASRSSSLQGLSEAAR